MVEAKESGKGRNIKQRQRTRKRYKKSYKKIVEHHIYILVTSILGIRKTIFLIL